MLIVDNSFLSKGRSNFTQNAFLRFMELNSSLTNKSFKEPSGFLIEPIKSFKRIIFWFDVSLIKLRKSPVLVSPKEDVGASKIIGYVSSLTSLASSEIASKIEKQPVTGRLIYKGGDLNPEEQQFLNTYVQALGGGELDKSKDKGYGQKMVYNN